MAVINNNNNQLPVSVSPMPTGLREALPNPGTPWRLGNEIFDRIKYQPEETLPYKSCELLESDPELDFVLKYFWHQKPPGRGIRKIHCIHNPSQTESFEGRIKTIEQEAENPAFAPKKGHEDEPKNARENVLKRWEKLVEQFSPIQLTNPKGRIDRMARAKVLPLWHGTTEKVCQSICKAGFTFFGKQHMLVSGVTQGTNSSTDIGYFGSGIYFTTSAQYANQYATMTGNEGHLLLAWVSMREPYPVVNNVPHPQEGHDMKKLEGHGHYDNYNAHYIPVASRNPNSPYCMEYYPCYQNQPAAWDELVVFDKSQTLPRFWIELGVEFPKGVTVSLQDIYQKGVDLAKNNQWKHAFYVFEHVAAQGLSTAQYQLGLCYYYGLGAPKNLIKALENFEKSLRQNALPHQKDLSLSLLAASQGKLDALKCLYEQNPNSLQEKTLTGITPLQLAAQGGHIDVMDWLFTLDLQSLDPSLLDGAILSQNIPIMRWILQNGHFKALSFARKEWGDDKVETFIQVLQGNSFVQTLDLKRNILRTKTGLAIGALLKTNSHLMALNLEKNELKDAGAKAIGEGLVHNTTLLQLNLMGNSIGDEGGIALISSMRGPLQDLNLSANSLTDRTIAKLAEVLKGNHSLQKLHLWGNQISDRGVELLIAALQGNTSLQELSLHTQENSQGQLKPIKKELIECLQKQNPGLVIKG